MLTTIIMKLWWSLLVMSVAILAIATATPGNAGLWDDHDEFLVRVSRGANKERVSCRYSKGDWSACDVKTNTRTRTLSLKKGDAKTCEQTKTIEKRCKKGVALSTECRYEKGSWSECVNQLMNRIDNLKPESDRACEKTRRRSKRCKPEPNSKKTAKSDRSNKKSGKQ
ncbi:pleiotrophin-like isoform X4 [Athalia rosae]|uniref:pleiotrophin-like isoform X4 n=1 Tax=Athalia rosae TaxID=37344 RepID=UPI000A0ED2BF|nr:pleiotrophin-like isoform X4 [Athalia rosae]